MEGIGEVGEPHGFVVEESGARRREDMGAAGELGFGLDSQAGMTLLLTPTGPLGLPPLPPGQTEKQDPLDVW